ncbi:MBL fold metallo-hydrolase [Frankia sp. CNm7]|uniref:MBL fold metallo-hydrolase n=1 Tax=Frankia nepalensis TaxID=1836974 RepID=A0A937RI28_9ACTN|nr:MBL fold metallo-hydrolase [Frankia nepalensis]MBL7502724.1 MBL fold metallo-hydrolase [Frankia nepalensis]MBL7515114.1 MBL fold metallo-hydrolase [Frankia nepalensis]MBL7521292.1 MBL fold metallo-hydrolase [Frankia nepalensis]MBL7629239.1 MBL fold metallo-hydrolase [Frankia nepalensis]
MSPQRQPLNALIVKEGEGVQAAVPLGDGIFASRGISNSYLVTSPDGDLLINTGMYFEAEQIRERFAQVSDNPVRVIVFTQGHPDHVGGWSQLDAPGVETIAQANHADVREYFHRLQPFFARRSGRLWSRDITNVDRSYQPPEPVVTTTFRDSHAFTLGGRRFELYSTPGGETTDSLVVWLPEERILFTGNLTGPLFGHIPNLYTVRGDKIRSAIAYLHSVDRILALSPEQLITGHGEPIRGADDIRRRLTQMRDATAYVRDRTIEGMNAGVDLWTLMGQITLPPALDIPQGHGKVPWIVRAIWEEHTGWFRYESTTELYDVPPSAIWDDLIELTGGTAPLLARAEAHLAAGRALHALHFAEIVLSQTPKDPAALRVKLEAHELLLARSGRENFSEVRWLEAEIRDIQEALS